MRGLLRVEGYKGSVRVLEGLVAVCLWIANSAVQRQQHHAQPHTSHPRLPECHLHHHTHTTQHNTRHHMSPQGELSEPIKPDETMWNLGELWKRGTCTCERQVL